MVQNRSATQPAGQNTASALQPTPQQQTAAIIYPITPTEVLVSRLPHQNGLNWVFHDPAVGSVRQVNVPYMHPMAQQSVNQSVSQPTTTSRIVLYQQPPNQIPQHMPQMALANQPMTPPPIQTPSAAQPMAPASPGPMQVPNQQVDWTTKIAEVIRE